MSPGTRVDARRALVVGGASGIGRALVAELAAGGAHVVVADLDAAGADAAASSAGGCAALEVDVADAASVERCVAAAERELGGLDAVASTAGVLVAGDLEALTDEAWDRCVRVNLTGSFHVARCVAPRLRAAGGGALVLTSSTSGLAGARGQAAYCAAKHGIVGLTRALADELAQDGIRVNCVCPGWVDTPFNDPVWQHAGGRADAERALLATVPARRQATPAEVAPSMAFLLSDAAAYVTGVALEVDGGLMAAR